MASGGRSSSSARPGRAKRAKGSAQRAKGSARIDPLYKRLPHGPHRLARNEVILHQRARLHGAMVEAVARSGYEATSVKQVIGLAGVSRRSFYEQFANKEECFLATFDVIVRRDLQQIRRAYLATDGPLEDRARAVFQRVAQATRDDRNATVLVVLEAQRAGPAGVLRLRRATGACEQMLAQSFAEAPGASASADADRQGDRRRPARGRLDVPARRTRHQGPRPRRGDAALDAALPDPRDRTHEPSAWPQG